MHWQNGLKSPAWHRCSLIGSASPCPPTVICTHPTFSPTCSFLLSEESSALSPLSEPFLWFLSHLVTLTPLHYGQSLSPQVWPSFQIETHLVRERLIKWKPKYPNNLWALVWKASNNVTMRDLKKLPILGLFTLRLIWVHPARPSPKLCHILQDVPKAFSSTANILALCPPTSTPNL